MQNKRGDSEMDRWQWLKESGDTKQHKEKIIHVEKCLVNMDTWKPLTDQVTNGVNILNVSNINTVVVPAFLSVTNGKMYTLLYSLLLPSKSLNAFIDTIVQMLKKHYSFVPLIIAKSWINCTVCCCAETLWTLWIRIHIKCHNKG